MYRTVSRILTARPASDGAGVKLNRVFGGDRTNKEFDPFLMLDEFGSDEASDYIAGFPSHPHRGFETVTYMLNGKMLHEDHLGNQGLLNGGDVQWMTAARGIIHSEMPQQEEGLMRGFQLWVNLPSNEKMKDPYYRDIETKDIPEVEFDGIKVRVIAGDVVLHDKTLKGAVNGLSTEPVYLDVHMPENSVVEIPVTDGHTALVYVYENEVMVADDETVLKAFSVASFSREGKVKVTSKLSARFLLLSGKPIGEPIAQYGPFVMNTPQEIDQAIQDYRDGSLTS
ncbi:MAG: pirin family protein [Gammaproteobacteria bacterium]|nr:pirin family protein [Gammaproteobacteria bacterium]